ncbi:hypothetical protein V8F20_008848 [Naviculisporaceae sp. PSN 640]
MASRILSPRLGLRGAQHIQTQIRIQCQLEPRRCLSLTARLQFASKKSPTKQSSPSSSKATSKAKTKPYQPQPTPNKSQSQPPPQSKTTNPNSSSKAESLDVLWKQRRVPLIFAGAAAFCIALYTSLLITKLTKAGDACTVHGDATPTGLPQDLTSALASPNQESLDPEKLRQTAEDFDRDLNLPERLSGVRRLRKNLAARAKGHVLEVSIGTGRNLSFYDWTDLVADYLSSPEATAERQRAHMDRLIWETSADGSSKKINSAPERKAIGSLEGEILSFTGLDISPDMLSIARSRVRENVPGLEQIMHKRRREPMPRNVSEGEGAVVVDVLDSKVRLFMGDAQSFLPPPLNTAATSTELKKYDTILQTFGLCSVADPSKLLSNMASVIKPDTGRIILLEHGRGLYDWINSKLDQFALPHFRRYGCWWNRDIEAIVRDAAKRVPGLEVVGVERPFMTHFGTTLVIELRVRSRTGEEQTTAWAQAQAQEGGGR